ncbi:N-acetylmuramoyl-L-alanine amidase [Endozoicomonas sp. Mp262]|uniref:N-acetylmuramoyl-L-alanine amidase n=1 Tax=Endozoicomonas sp. Mp262 TaxID=2919499 RepID=UPI0021DA17A8
MAKRKETHFIVLHCSATRADQKVSFEDIKRWHMLERAFMDIGYHWVIERDGSVKQGRGCEQWGAHCRGHNHESVGICLVGGLNKEGDPEDNFTAIQKQMLKLLVTGLQSLYPVAQVKGHNHFNRLKDCPCFDVEQWLAEASIQTVGAVA